MAPVVSVNADYTDGPWSLLNVTAVMPGSVFTFVQEGKRIQFREHLSQLVGVKQGKREDRAGSAVLYDRQRVEVLDKGIKLGVEPDHQADIMARWFQWVLGEVDGTLQVAAIAGHRPPPRDRHLWPAFDDSLQELVDYFNTIRVPVLIGMDTNSLNPAALARGMGLRWSGHGIDGFMWSPQLHLSKAHRMKRTRSDHRAVLAFLPVPHSGGVPLS